MKLPKYKHKYATYLIVAVVILAPQYHGWRGLTDSFATWKNGGFPAEDARCAVAFNVEVE